MKRKITLSTFVLSVALVLSTNDSALFAQQKTLTYNSLPGQDGYRIIQQSNQSIKVGFSIRELTIVDEVINGEAVKSLSLPGMFLPGEEGAPLLPGNLRYLAMPRGAQPVLTITSSEVEIIENITIGPAPVIPLDEYNSPIVYKKNEAIYTKDEFYPQSPAILTDQSQIRGVDVIMLGITPFQYNPVTKQLRVFKNLEVEVKFQGGNGQFGDVTYRSRWWDQLMEDVVFNYNQLPKLDYNALMQNSGANKTQADQGCEYAIIIPNGPDFKVWADSILKFRTEQGILTKIYTLSDIGSTTATGIKAWVKNAYDNWTIKPAAMLILADYGTDANSTVISNLYPHNSSSYPDFASDNFYADLTGDEMPDVIFSRITANNATQLKVMCSKFLSYERNPPTDVAFYDKPVVAEGWQDDRWFQLGAEIFGGYLATLSKHQMRINELGSPAKNSGGNVANSGTWSTASNTSTIIKYFGQSGLKYIPDQPGTLGGFSGGKAANINTALNSGAFMLLHRDHGFYGGWGEPSYSTSNVTSLTNVDNRLPFIFSVNCQTGAYHRTSDCFTEKMHRYTYNGKNSGALGLIAATEVSYSFVNDAFIWGMFDNMWPNFMPAYGTTPASRDMRPAFGNAAGKYFLKQSSWAGTSTKSIAYRLFHMHGDAFQWFYSEVPKNLKVAHTIKSWLWHA